MGHEAMRLAPPKPHGSHERRRRVMGHACRTGLGPGLGCRSSSPITATKTQPAAQDCDPRPGRPLKTSPETCPAAQDRDPLLVSSCLGDFVVETGSRHRWRDRMRRADLLQRTMGLVVLACPRCGGRLEPIAEILEPGAVAKILRSMGLPDTLPHLSPARSPPEADFDFGQEGWSGTRFRKASGIRLGSLCPQGPITVLRSNGAKISPKPHDGMH
jgi:hypothetical protein